MRGYRLILEKRRLNEAAEFLLEISRLRKDVYVLKDVLAMLYREGTISDAELIEALRLLALPLSRIDIRKFTPIEEEVVGDLEEVIEERVEPINDDVEVVEERYVGQGIAERLRI